MYHFIYCFAIARTLLVLCVIATMFNRSLVQSSLSFSHDCIQLSLL